MVDKNSTRKKVLLTGATGFIGQHCLRELIQEGYDIIATYHARIPETEHPEQVKWVQVDLTDDLKPVEDILCATPIDTLLHVAWNMGKGYQNNAENTIWLEKSVELVSLFIKHGGNRVATAGTNAEYAISQHELKEDGPLNPDTLYGKCKRSLYMEVEQLCKAKQISYVHMRIFYTFGKGESEIRVIPYVIDELLAGRSPICSSGVQVLDYMCVEDIARAIVQCLKRKDLHGSINIGSGEGVELRDLLTFIADKIDGDTKITFAKEKPGDRKIDVADVSRLREAVGFVPSMSRDEAILRYIKQRKEQAVQK